MFLYIWNFLRGYVVIAVSGFSVERFLNLAANRGVFLWDARREDGTAVMKVSAKGFKLLRPAARKTRCKVKIIRKAGLPFVFFRYRKRKFFALGALFLIGFLYFITSFLWLVTVEGGDRVPEENITEFLAENGFRVGGSKYGHNLRLLENDMMIRFPDIAWVNISVTGTHATVKIVETIPPAELVDRHTPCDVVAAKDGLIVSMATSSGSPKYSVGDVVREGDVIVSGELVVGNDETGFYTYYVHARSEVYAKMYYELEFNVPLSYTQKNYSGNAKRNYGIILFGRTIYLENTESPFVNYDKTISEKRLDFGENYPLPAIWFVENYREYEPSLEERTPDEAKILGAEMVDGRIARELPPGAEVTDKHIEYEPGDGFIRVSARITTIERIDISRTFQEPAGESAEKQSEESGQNPAE